MWSIAKTWGSAAHTASIRHEHSTALGIHLCAATVAGVSASHLAASLVAHAIVITWSRLRSHPTPDVGAP